MYCLTCGEMECHRHIQIVCNYCNRTFQNKNKLYLHEKECSMKMYIYNSSSEKTTYSKPKGLSSIIPSSASSSALSSASSLKNQHSSSKHVEDLSKLKKGFEKALEKVYFDARKEIQELQQRLNDSYQMNETELIELKKEISRLERVNQDLISKINYLEEIKKIEDNQITKHAKEISDRDIEISNLYMEIETLKAQHSLEFKQYCEELPKSISMIEEKTKESIETKYIEQVAILEKQIEDLKKEYNLKLSENTETLRNKYTKLIEETETKWSEKYKSMESTFTKNIKDKDFSIGELSSNLTILRSNYDSIMEQFQEIKKQSVIDKNALEERINHLNSQIIHPLQETNKQLVSESQEYKKNIQRVVEKAKDEKTELNSTIYILNNEKKEVSERLNTTTKKISELQHSLELCNDKIKSLEQRNKYLNDDLTKKKEQYDVIDEQYRSFVQISTATINEERDRVSRLKQELYDTKQKIVDIQALTVSNEEKDKKIADLEMIIKKLESEITIKKEELYHLSTSLDELKKNRVKLESQIEEGNEKYKKLNMIYDDLIRRYNALENSNKTINISMDKDINKLNDIINIKNKEISNLQQQLMNYEQDNKEIREFEKLVQQYKQKLMTVQTDLKITEQNSEKIIERYKIELNEAKNRIQELESKIVNQTS